MANYFVSYDLNGRTPSHDAMDTHMAAAGWARGRVLETLWYVGATGSAHDIYDHVNAILTDNDRLLVIEASDAHFRNLLIGTESLQHAWQDNQ